MNVLVLTSEPIGAQSLRRALPDSATDGDVEVMVVAPALHESPIKFWLSDADEAISRAHRVSRETLEHLSDAGVPAAADTGESDPLDAVEDALQTFKADRIVIFTHPEGEQRYREQLDPDEVTQRFGIPVDRATVRPT
jgi:predicted TIM-barrel enzyme